MKRYTSRFLKTVAALFLAFPIAYLIAAAVLFDIPAHLCVRILLSPSYYLLSLLAMIAGYGLWEMHRWAWYFFIAVCVLIAYQNAIFINEYGETHHKFLAFAASLFLIAALVYRLAREIRVPYFFPKIRWWESNPRYRLSVPVTVIRSSQGESVEEAQILDLSMGGCFIKMRSDLPQDEPLELKFSVFGHPIHVEGTAVWRTQSTVTHPRGVGVKFGAVAKEQRRTLRLIVRRLRKIATFYRRARYLMNQDEFLKRLDEMESHRTFKE